MEGILLTIDPVSKTGTVDTRNDQLKTLTIYFTNDLPTNIKTNCTVDFDVKVSSKGNAYAKFNSVVERNTAIFNTEDRELWYSWGENFETAFIEKVVPLIQLDIRKNPEKEKFPWAIDLYDFSNNHPADLKVQNTPFFTAGKYNYGNRPYDPTYTVTFNQKDYANYASKHPDCDIYFWVNWTQLAYKKIRVKKINGVWRAPFAKMAALIQNNSVALHSYLHRTNDDHNAKASYLFMLSDPNVFQRLL